MMIKLAILNFIMQSLNLVSSQSLTNYVTPTRNNSSLCPQSKQCITLNEYAADPGEHFLSNTTFIFLPGTHQLDDDIRLENLQNVPLLRADPELVTISLGPLASITWMNCYDIEITSILIEIRGSFEHGIIFVNSSGIQISNTSFTRRGARLGCSALAFLSSTAQISDSSFAGLSCQLGAVMATSLSIVSFSANNVFTNNTALFGSALYSTDSVVTFSGANQLTNNRAAVWNTELLSQCSNYSVQTVASSNLNGGLGGAIYGKNSSLIINGSFIFINNSAEVSGGAIAVFNNSMMQLLKTLITCRALHSFETESFLAQIFEKMYPFSQIMDLEELFIVRIALLI